MIRTLTKSPATPKQNYPGYAMTEEAFREALDRGIDKVVKEEWSQPFVAERFFRQFRTKRSHGKIIPLRGISGVVPLNADEDTMPVANSGVGFSWTWDTYDFRLAAYYSRKAEEVDEVGATKGRQRELLAAWKRTVEGFGTDVFNRAFGTNGASVLASDGCYLIDDNRPNPNPDGGTWSNKETTADLTEDTIFEAVKNAAQQVNTNGDLFPTRILEMVIPVTLSKKMWVLLNSSNKVGGNDNDSNYAAGMFSMKNVFVHPYLTTQAVFYILCDPKSEDNELVMPVRVPPTVLTQWGMNGNPDVLGQRIRASFGIALGDPRKFIRGGLIAEAG